MLRSSIKSNIRLLMAEARIDKISEVVRLSGLSRGAVNKIYHEDNLGKIQLETLLVLCEVFGCTLNDLIQTIKIESEDSNIKEPKV